MDSIIEIRRILVHLPIAWSKYLYNYKRFFNLANRSCEFIISSFEKEYSFKDGKKELFYLLELYIVKSHYRELT